MSAPDYIAEAITGHYGERCEDFDPACYCCQAWAQYDPSQASVAAALEAAAAKLRWMWNADGTVTERRVSEESQAAIRSLITPDQRTALQVAIDAAKAEARAEDARARGYSSADVSDIVEAFRIAGPIALADFKSHPFILNDKEEAAVALITAALAQIGAKP